LPEGSKKTTKYFSQNVRYSSCDFKPGQPECVERINQINHRISLKINKFRKETSDDSLPWQILGFRRGAVDVLPLPGRFTAQLYRRAKTSTAYLLSASWQISTIRFINTLGTSTWQTRQAQPIHDHLINTGIQIQIHIWRTSPCGICGGQTDKLKVD